MRLAKDWRAGKGRGTLGLSVTITGKTRRTAHPPYHRKFLDAVCTEAFKYAFPFSRRPSFGIDNPLNFSPASPSLEFWPSLPRNCLSGSLLLAGPTLNNRHSSFFNVITLVSDVHLSYEYLKVTCMHCGSAFRMPKIPRLALSSHESNCWLLGIFFDRVSNGEEKRSWNNHNQQRPRAWPASLWL